ncbi:hypothetical protein DV735_g2834, partial [Chaetothyriales sp. CBS 134920]
MLPDFLKDSYKQYKDDTDRFATWLVSMAEKCGYNLDTLPTSGLDANSNSHAPEPKLYQVSVRELYKLAEVVSNSSVKAPPSILAVAKRAVSLRKTITSYFIGKGSSASNRRHAYFIEVLEDICKSLISEDTGALVLAKKDDKGADSVENADDPAWLNLFASLTVEAVEDITETVSDGRELVKVVAVEDDEAADPGDDDARFFSHAFFRVFCLFHDLENWRTFLSQTWIEYGDRKIDLMTASIITDSALQLAQELIQETVADMPRGFPKDSMGLQKLVYVSSCLRSGKGMSPDIHLGLTFSLEMADVAEWTYMGVGTLLESMVDIIHDDSIPLYKPGYFGVYNPKADRRKMSVPEKFNEDKVILLEILPEFCIIDRFKVQLPVQDEITRGFVNFTKSKKTTLWLCFAIQVLLDAIHATRASRLGGWADLRLTGLRISKTIDDYWKLSKTHPKPQFWPAEGELLIKNIREYVGTFIERDPLQAVKDMAAQRVGRAGHASDHLMFSRNPVLCGLMAFQLNLRMQTAGQALVTQWYDVQQLAFLYNLVQQAPGQTISWPDMELFIKIHGEDHIFIGNRPKDAAQSLNRLEIVTGISSVTRLASDARERNPWHRPDGKSGRKLEPTTKVANIFRERYQEEDGGAARMSPSICSAQVSKYLDELSETAADKNKPNKSKKQDKSKELALALAAPDQFLGRRWQSAHNVGALQLLALIKGKLREEEPVLLFNYFAMHRRSIEILRQIKAKEHHKFVQYFTEGYMPDETMISNLVLLIHHVARGSVANGQQLGLSKSAQITSRMVVSCGDVLREYVAKHGDETIRELRAFCRNTDFLSLGKTDKKEVDHDTMYVFGMEQLLSPGQLESLRTGIPLA